MLVLEGLLGAPVAVAGAGETRKAQGADQGGKGEEEAESKTSPRTGGRGGGSDSRSDETGDRSRLNGVAEP